MFVSEVCDLYVANCTVGPSDDILLGLASDDLEVMDAHELPDDGKRQFLVSVQDVLGSNSHKLQLELSTSIKSHLAVNTLLEVVVWILFNSVPFNNVRVNLVNDF